jgi:hypothetical protein
VVAGGKLLSLSTRQRIFFKVCGVGARAPWLVSALPLRR